MKRKIISIDEDTCNGCGNCIPGCPEGAIQMIDGKARLISDLFCDGLGACLGQCPEEAITIEEREAEPYDEPKVMANIVKQGSNTIAAHLIHLKEHNESEYLKQALSYLAEHQIGNPLEEMKKMNSHSHTSGGGCPGSRSTDFAPASPTAAADQEGTRPSELTHWPIQLHLISPAAAHFRGRDLLLAADCVPFTMGDFHKDFLKGKTLAIACPKLDGGQEVYLEKLTALIDEAKINTLQVMIMQVPCCGGLLRLAQEAASRASRKVPVKCTVVSLQGDVLQEQWV
jgi:ferredoxin